MRVWKPHFWKVALLGGAVSLLGWVGWRYADQRRPALLALNTTTGKLQWVQPLGADVGYSKGPIASEGKIFLGACLDHAAKRCSAYQLQAFDAQSGKALWTLQPKGRYAPYEIASNQAVNIQNGQLYLQLEEELQAIDPATGNQRWTIPRRCFFVPPGVWYGMGLVSHSNVLAILNINGKEQVLQTLDSKTGKVLQQATRSLDKLTTTKNLITADDRTLFLESSGLVPADVPNTFFSSGTSTITAYDLKTLEPRFRTAIQGDISYLQVVGSTLQLRTSSEYDGARQTIVTGNVLAISATSGQRLWQKNRAQLGCREDGYSWRADADTVYLNCDRNGRVLYKSQESKIVALSAQTGQVKWQTQISPDRYSDNLPATVNGQQYLTFRLVTKEKQAQTQAIALDRQTGKVLWAFPLFDPEAKYVDTWQSIVAAEGDRFFTLDVLPRWQLWLLQVNRNWSVKSAW